MINIVKARLINWKPFCRWFGMIPNICPVTLCYYANKPKISFDIDIFPSLVFYKLHSWLIVKHRAGCSTLCHCFLLLLLWNMKVNICFDGITLDSREKSRSRLTRGSKKKKVMLSTEHEPLFVCKQKLLSFSFCLISISQIKHDNMTMPFFRILRNSSEPNGRAWTVPKRKKTEQVANLWIWSHYDQHFVA